jgi:uncharacterized protein YndB with AHSA1/START domain
MEKLHFTVIINAPREKVWQTMLNDSTYRQWSNVFNPPGSYFEGSWEQGSKILFLGPGKNNEIGGMLSRIKENRLNEFISIEHLGEVINGKEDTSKSEIWKGALENYTFKTTDGGGTKLIIEVDTLDDFKAYLLEKWPMALQKLKEISEANPDNL